jgi:hypothetical protein
MQQQLPPPQTARSAVEQGGLKISPMQQQQI